MNFEVYLCTCIADFEMDEALTVVFSLAIEQKLDCKKERKTREP